MSAAFKKQYTGVLLAILAVVIWSGNFVVARSAIKDISPFSLAFFRWACASVVILPLSFKMVKREWLVIKTHAAYLFWVALSGIALFNTFIYIAGHYTTAINLALIGTTSSPVIAVILSRFFLKEQIGWLKLLGMLCCIAGVLFLLSRGSWENLTHFHVGIGDKWVLLSAACFAVYSVLVRKKPTDLSGVSFLCSIFCLGTMLLLPFYAWDFFRGHAVHWTPNLTLIIVYLGVGASVISYLCWNTAIQYLGAGRTALFGNLIPLFSSIEATFFLQEKFTWFHIVSMAMVFSGIALANWKAFKRGS